MEQMCKTCRYWEKLADLVSGHIVVGDCRRYPPTVCQADSTRALFPCVEEEAWCGEWKEIKG